MVLYITTPQLQIKTDTRGPSWPCASVDSKIEISHWKGYFYSVPGEVKWFAQIIAVETEALVNSFGQIRSGILTICSLQGVMRIIPGEASHQDLEDGKTCIGIDWDTQELKRKFGPSRIATASRYPEYGSSPFRYIAGESQQDVFYMPIRIMEVDSCGFDYEKPTTKRLLLLPTEIEKYQFWRTGQFELSEKWRKDGAIKPFESPTKISSAAYCQSMRKDAHSTQSRLFNIQYLVAS
jgi:hypothetical protein